MAVLSALCNLFIFSVTLLSLRVQLRRNSLSLVMRYFTNLSNVLCAFSCLAVALMRLCGAEFLPVLVFKYAGTVCVAITMLTVLLFLGPLFGYKSLLTGWQLWLHLLAPLLAMISYFAWDRPAAGWHILLAGLLPELLYGLLYLWKVVLKHCWDDFYGFNRQGRWPLSFAAMAIGGILISYTLWAV